MTAAMPGPCSRRTFLALSGAVVLAACGGSGSGSGDSSPGATDGGSTGTDGTDSTGTTGGEPFILVQRWPSTSLTPGPVRLPMSIADRDRLLPSGPAELRGQIVDAMSGDVVVPEVIAARRGDDLPIPYWAFRVELDEGLYVLRVEGGSADGAAIQVRDPSQYLVPRVGQPLPPFDTPTTDDARGLDPICTRPEGVCALHSMTLTEALASNRPVAYLVGTPAFCQTGTCAPALDSLLEMYDRLGDAVALVHAEIYTDSTATTVAEAVTAYSMDYEPALFVADASGTIVERLDAVFDTAEVVDALRLAGASV